MTKNPKTTARGDGTNDAELVDGIDPSIGKGAAGLIGQNGPEAILPQPSPEVAAAWAAMMELGEKAAAKAFPLLKAAIEAHGREFNSVRISARKEGFRRGGIAHPAAATDHAAGTFTPQQLEAWLGETNLTVTLV